MTRLIWAVEDASITNAGISIRINPIIERLQAQGIDVSLVTYKDLIGCLLNASGKPAIATYVFSKPHRSEYLSCMLALQSIGCRVGIDIFDNYYSESGALREFGVQSIWKNILHEADFCVFSTMYLLEYARKLEINSKDMFVIGDPVYPDSYEPLKKRGVTKWNQFLQECNYINVAWFGIDANPYFFAGLSDIFFEISRLREFLEYPSWFFKKRIRQKVSICTKDVPDSRKLVIELNRIGINAEFVQWSRDTCTQLLEESHAVFLPTNNSDFSLSKTHNRLAEALSSNCLVYTCPNSLYTQFKSPLCIDSYSEFARLFADLSSGSDIAEKSQIALEHISRLIKNNDDSTHFCNFLMRATKEGYSRRNRIVSLVGTTKDAENIKILRKAGAIIAGVISPLIKSPPSYDHIELIQDDQSIRIRYNIERIQALHKLTSVNQSTTGYRCHLKSLPNTCLEFQQTSTSNTKYVDLTLVDCGKAFQKLLMSKEMKSLDKSLTFRNSHSRLFISSLYECLYHFCYTHMELCDPIIISGSSPIGSFMDNLIDSSD